MAIYTTYQCDRCKINSEHPAFFKNTEISWYQGAAGIKKAYLLCDKCMNIFSERVKEFLSERQV